MRALSRRTYAILAIVFAAVIFIGLNMGADATFTTARLDLTQNGQYTLSQGTKNILRNLKEPILLKFFYSKKTAADYAQINAYAARVHDLLNEYAALSHGRLVVEEIDPEPFTAAEDEATSSGLSGAPTQTGDVVYFGLVGTNTIDGKETIPFFTQDREPFVEYDLTSLIYHLSHPKKPKIGIISSIPLQAGAGGIQAMLQGRSRPYIAYQQLAQSYDVQMLQRNIASIPSGIDVLMIVHPQALTDQQQYAIDQFVLRGGRALVFVDPASEISNVGGGAFNQQQGPTSSDLPKLFKAWGVAYDPAKVVGDRDLAQPVQAGDPRNPIQPYPIWLHLTASNFDHKDQVTGQLQTMNLASVGALSPVKGAGTAFAPLVQSSDNAGLLDAMMVRFNPDPQSLMTQIVPAGHPFTIAARISGIAKTAFPKGPPAPEKSDNSKQSKPSPPANQAPQLKVSTGPVNIIVMADTDIFDDKFWVRLGNMYGRAVAAPFADNGAFILNAIENLTGSSDLISLRTRSTNDRPFIVVKKLQAEAQAKFQQQQQALQQKLTDTQQRLRELQQGGQPGKGNTGLSLAQQQEIERFRRELIDTRAKIREVQLGLRASVDELGGWLTFLNIAAVPLLVALFAILLAIVRRRRRARAIAF